MTLPRVLTLSPDGELLQTPAPETALLRGDHLAMKQWKRDDAGREFDGPKTDSVEILAEFVPGSRPCGFRFRVAEGASGGVPVTFDGKVLNVAGEQVPFVLKTGESSLKLHIFLDRSALEVYANDRIAVTRVIEADPKALRIIATASDGANSLKRLDAWIIPADDVFRDASAPYP